MFFRICLLLFILSSESKMMEKIAKEPKLGPEEQNIPFADLFKKIREN